jgi:hypothetical protein
MEVTRMNAELRDGLKQGFLLGAAVLVLAIPPRFAPPSAAPIAGSVGAPAAPVRAVPQRRLDFAGQTPSPEAREVAQWVVDSADNGDRSFAILDKRHARVYVFEPSGLLAGATPVLLGYAAGDDSVPGIGQRPIDQVRPEERTTPAGRFIAEPGRNALHEDVLWVDYGAAVSMHRVRLTNPAEHRAERLASPTEDDNRISYGCINMPVSFFENVLWPRFRAQGGNVYVLPEVKPLVAVFPALRDRLAREAVKLAG